MEALVAAGGSFLETDIPERSRSNVFGDPVAGLAVYRRLEKLGLLYFTEEDPFDMPGDPLDGFQFTPMVYITDEGRRALSDADKAAAETSHHRGCRR